MVCGLRGYRVAPGVPGEHLLLRWRVEVPLYLCSMYCVRRRGRMSDCPRELPANGTLDPRDVVPALGFSRTRRYGQSRSRQTLQERKMV